MDMISGALNETNSRPEKLAGLRDSLSGEGDSDTNVGADGLEAADRPQAPRQSLFPGLSDFLRALPQEAAAGSPDSAPPQEAGAGPPDSAPPQEEVSSVSEEEKKRRLDQLLPEDSSARSIKTFLDDFVVGQDAAIVALAVLFSMHLRWFLTSDRLHRAPNAILVGATGVGKTHTLKTAAEFLKLPFVVVDATSLVPSGAARGQQVEEVLTELILAAGEMLRQLGTERFSDDDIALAERGIIFLDEFDKLADDLGDVGNLGAWNRTTQRRLLKLTEGSTIGVETFVEGTSTRRVIDTSGILFIAGGAFAGIDSLEIRAARGDKINRALRPGNEIISRDIVNFGFIPELVARLPIIVNFEALSARTLLQILRTESVTPLGVWRNHFRQLGKQLRVTQGAEVEIAKRAASLEMGARGLHQTLFPLLAERAYDFESANALELTIDVDAVTGGDVSS